MTPEFRAHLARVELENETERFASAPPGTFERAYRGLGAPLDAPGWARVWVAREGRHIVAHASAYDSGEPGVVFGHISIERAYRGQRLAPDLQAARFAFLDAHDLTLMGAVAYGNDHSFHGCRRAGFEFAYYDPQTRETWVFRPPRAAARP